MTRLVRVLERWHAHRTRKSNARHIPPSTGAITTRSKGTRNA